MMYCFFNFKMLKIKLIKKKTCRMCWPTTCLTHNEIGLNLFIARGEQHIARPPFKY